jgi:two-component sensor histidine kinase
VPSLNDIAVRHTELTEADVERLHLLLADWQLLADLAFSDLVLWLPTWNGSGYVAGAQMRPTTGATVFGDDLVGTFLPRGRRPLLDEALELGRVVRSRTEHALAPAEAIPVRGDQGRVVAVVARHVDPATSGTRGRLETAYLEVASHLSRMVAEGTFPFRGGLEGLDSSPRAGDGFVRLAADGLAVYASPNALSAYRRLGLSADLVGSRLDVVTRQLVPRRGPLDEDLVAVAGGRSARGVEFEGKGTTVQLRGIPLLADGKRFGAVVLVRDVTELRRRERELLTKDATIREIHHRVKNNLQTVAALLRLQARRISVPEGRAALEEAVRRVGSIALVHELLSTAPDENVPFDQVADRVLLTVAELSSPEVHVRPRRTGSFGSVPAQVATPLAMVLSELVQNAVEHGLRALPERRSGDDGLLEVTASRTAADLTVSVLDAGVGLPAGFDLERNDRLGLQIVRTLVEGELGGKLVLEPRPGGGTGVTLRLPIDGW